MKKFSNDDEFRTCTCCGKTFPNTKEYFSKNNGKGLNSICKSCQPIKTKEKNEKMKARFTTNKIEYDGEKVCKKCNRSLPNSYRYFPVDKSCVSGLRNVCRECNGKFSGFLPEDFESSKKWTLEEDNLLKEKYKDYTDIELHELFFPDRSIRAIGCHAATLGIQGKSEEEKLKRNKIRNKKISQKLTGRKLTEEQKQMISERNKKYYQTHTPYWLGRKRSEEQCKQISLRMKGRWSGDKNPRHIKPLRGSENGNWRGGVNKIYAELRSEIKDWQDESMRFCGYKCVITGKGFDNIHHIMAFRNIVDEAFAITGLDIRDKVMDYSTEEFNILLNEIKYLHVIYGYGACLFKDVHKLFHDTYGYMNFKPDNFLDFVYRIDCGDFDEYFELNNLEINVNYTYIEYLENILFKLNHE